jgi:hypothetical protein
MCARERVAQLVEHMTFNHGVPGSSPGALTNPFNDLRGIFCSAALYRSDRGKFRASFVLIGIVTISELPNEFDEDIGHGSFRGTPFAPAA